MTLTGVAAGVGDVPAVGMLAAVKAVKRVAEIEAMRVAGPDRRLSGMGRRGRLTTFDDLDVAGAAAEATVHARPPGLWALVSYGAAPHVIGFGRSRGGGNYRQAGRNRNKRLRIGGSWVTGPVYHPGTSGQNSWAKVKKRSRPIVVKIFRDALHEAVSGG